MIPACRAGCSGSNPDRGVALPLRALLDSSHLDRTLEGPLNLREGTVGSDAGVVRLGRLGCSVTHGSTHGLDACAVVLGGLREGRTERLEPMELHSAPLLQVSLQLPEPRVRPRADALSEVLLPQRNEPFGFLAPKVRLAIREEVFDCGLSRGRDRCEVRRGPGSIALRTRHEDASASQVQVLEFRKAGLLRSEPCEG